MDQGIAALLGALVGVGGSALASFLSGRHQAAAERAHWRRQSRRDAYAAFIEAVERFYDEIEQARTLLIQVRPDTEAASAHITQAKTHADELDRKTSLILLEGPDEVASAAESINECAEAWIRSLAIWRQQQADGLDAEEAQAVALTARNKGYESGQDFLRRAQEALA